jgi:hypothetical protein
MTKLSKRIVDAAEAREKDYVIWDDELPGFGLRVFASGKRSYLIQYRSAGRSRRYTVGQYGVWTPELARKEAKIQLGRVAQGDNPAEERQLDHNAITVKELCDLYFTDLKAGLILGKGGRPKKASTIVTDTGRINRHIVPLIGIRRVKDLVKADINKVLKDIMAGKTRTSVKTKKLRGNPRRHDEQWPPPGFSCRRRILDQLHKLVLVDDFSWSRCDVFAEAESLHVGHCNREPPIAALQIDEKVFQTS